MQVHVKQSTHVVESGGGRKGFSNLIDISNNGSQNRSHDPRPRFRQPLGRRLESRPPRWWVVRSRINYRRQRFRSGIGVWPRECLRFDNSKKKERKKKNKVRRSSIGVEAGLGVYVEPSHTCDRTSSREAQCIQDGNRQEGRQGRRSGNSCAGTGERDETGWMEA